MAQLSFGRKRKRKRVNYDLVREVLTWLVQIIAVCLIAFAVVWYFGFKVSIIGDSMKPELTNGDITLLNRLVYDVRAPKRGDVIAFKPNGNESSHYYVKRVIGLPGETVEYREGNILIDGEILEEDYTTTDIIELGLLEEPIVLKSGEFFVLGDDRQNSDDSRIANIGNVEREEIAGRVWFVISPKENFGFVK